MSDICYFDGVHPLGESTTRPIELQATRLGVMFFLAGSSLASSRLQLRNPGFMFLTSLSCI
jgi:hypothetical protein